MKHEIRQGFVETYQVNFKKDILYFYSINEHRTKNAFPWIIKTMLSPVISKNWVQFHLSFIC